MSKEETPKRGTAWVLIEKEGSVAVVTLNRPEVRNALGREVMQGLVTALDEFEKDAGVRCVVIAGNAQAFAAGADIKEIECATSKEMAGDLYLGFWDQVGRFPKPTIAAVSGFTLGGGLELALACDFIVASETAIFGQPEINIGIIPGAGGTQRLTRAVGKTLAMDMIVTGRKINAAEALRAGLISRVVPAESWLDEAKKLARDIAAKPPLAVRKAKECVLAAGDLDLEKGLRFEREGFCALLDSEDKKEGMKAFLEKRAAKFVGR